MRQHTQGAASWSSSPRQWPRASTLVALLFAAVLFTGQSAHAIDVENQAEVRVGLAGVSADGHSYALRFSWRLTGPQPSRCNYPATPEEPRPDGVALVLCRVGGSCEHRWVYRLPREGLSLDERLFTPAGNGLREAATATLRCTTQDEATALLAGARSFFVGVGIDFGRHGQRLKTVRRHGRTSVVLPGGTQEASVDLAPLPVGDNLVNDWVMARAGNKEPSPVRQARFFDQPHMPTPFDLREGFLLEPSNTVLLFAVGPMIADGYVSERDRLYPFNGAPLEVSLEQVAAALRRGK